MRSANSDRAIVFLLELSQRWLYFVYEYLDVTDYLFVIVYAILIYDNFKYAELAYHFFIEELFNRNEQFFEDLSNRLTGYFGSNWRSWFDYVVKGVANLLQVAISFLPEGVQPLLNIFVSTAGKLATNAAGNVTDDSASEISDTNSMKGD